MNRENVEKLRNFLRDEVPDGQFNMRDYLWRDDDKNPYRSGPAVALRDCKTAACIAGWACALKGARGTHFAYETEAAEWLGLGRDDAGALFVPTEDKTGGRLLSQLTRQCAVETLTRLLDTGEVDWGSP